MKVYKNQSQVSFVFRKNEPYYYIWLIGNEEMELSCGGCNCGGWSKTRAGQSSTKSNWLEVLLLTGRSRMEIQRVIKILQAHPGQNEYEL